MHIQLFSRDCPGYHFELEVGLFSFYIRVREWDWFGSVGG